MQCVARLRVTQLLRAQIRVVDEHVFLWCTQTEARVAHVGRALGVDIELRAVAVDRTSCRRLADTLAIAIACVAICLTQPVVAHLARNTRLVRTALDRVTRVIDALLAIIAALCLAGSARAVLADVAFGADISVIARVGVEAVHTALGRIARVGGAGILVIAINLVADAFAAGGASIVACARIAVGALHADLRLVDAAELGIAAVVGARGLVVAIDDLATALSATTGVARGAHAAVATGESCMRQCVTGCARSAEASNACTGLVRTDVAAHAVDVGLTGRAIGLGARGRR